MDVGCAVPELLRLKDVPPLSELDSAKQNKSNLDANAKNRKWGRKYLLSGRKGTYLLHSGNGHFRIATVYPCASCNKLSTAA